MLVTIIGRTELLYNTVAAVQDAGHVVERIVTCEAEDFYRMSAADFEDLAAEIGADFIHTEDINDDTLVDLFEESDSEIALSINWKTKIGREILDAFEHGVVNGHAGDLPRYRGNAAPNWAILNGEDEIVFTVHQMDEALDSGPILLKYRFPIDESTYLFQVYEAMRTEFPRLFARAVDGLEEGSLEPSPQPEDPKETLRAYPRLPQDSRLAWERPAQQLDRLVRASSEPLFGAFTYLGSQRLRVWRAHAETPPFDYLGTPGQVAERRPSAGEVAVITGDGFLVLERLQLADGPREAATDIIRSARTRLGMDLHEELDRLRHEGEESTDS